METPVTGDQFVTNVKNFAPVLAVLAAVLRSIPVLIVSGRARKRGRNPSHATIRIRTLESAAPWDKYDEKKELWPADWDNVETKRHYRRRERRWIWFFMIVFLAAAIVYGFFFADDVVSNFISFRDGTGFLAGPAFVLFLVLFSFQVRFLRKIWGDRGLKPSLYGACGSVTVTGELPEIRQYCLGALYEAGSTIVSCTDARDEHGEHVEIVAATGIWPPQWLNTGPLQLVSFRGQKVVVQVRPAGEAEWNVSVWSDNMDPGVDEGHRANERNARSFVEAWTFFPGSAEEPPATR
ncbi:hypothetical protein CF165_18500 [Amycolatopsis vastitatis]|uniref:Uncharacterized protein n=1 Tax=Amycolatopsis vastitatis TaxID=1905142 RepID=A0A229T6A5_9PSEU|nr:hypothetical protein CF165_18500 [Amycolatopsis vastitatis]